MSLRLRIVVAMVLVAGFAVTTAGFVARQVTRDNVTTVVDVAPSNARVQRIREYRVDMGTWSGVAALLDRFDRTSGVRLIITDDARAVIADSRPADPLPPLDRLPHDALRADGEVARLYSVAVEGDGAGSGTDDLTANLRSIDRSFLLAGIGAVVVATLVALLVAGRITRPLRTLARAVERTRAGDRSVRVPPGPGEVGDLGDAFNVLADELARSEQSRRSMIADAAHELRTPLANLRGHLEAVADGVVEPDADTMNGLIGDVQRLGTLVDDLQSLALVESGVVRLHLRRVAPKEILERAAAAQGATRDRLQIVVDTPPTLPMVMADDVRLPQVFDNLLANAARYATAVRLSARVAPRGVEFLVTDNGAGIPAAQLEAVFERFHRTDPSRGSWAGGAGLGLAITARLVDLHGGTIRAVSPPGQGATFVVCLPVAPPELGALPPPVRR